MVRHQAVASHRRLQLPNSTEKTLPNRNIPTNWASDVNLKSKSQKGEKNKWIALLNANGKIPSLHPSRRYLFSSQGFSRSV